MPAGRQSKLEVREPVRSGSATNGSPLTGGRDTELLGVYLGPFAAAWTVPASVHHLGAKLPWCDVTVLLDRLDEPSLPGYWHPCVSEVVVFGVVTTRYNDDAA